MDVERSSLCNCVVNFLLEENYVLSAFELLHELLDDGREAHAIRLKEFFSDSSLFPPEQVSRLNSLRVADPQSLLEEKSSLEEKLALTEYDFRLAQEDILRLKNELQKSSVLMPEESNGSHAGTSANNSEIKQERNKVHFSGFSPLKDSERRDLNCAVKEYLLLAGYRLTAMTFYEEVTDQKLDVWHESRACVQDALRHYYYQYLSSMTEAAEEKISLHEENKLLLNDNERLNHEKEALLEGKAMADVEVAALKKSLEIYQRDLKAEELLVQNLKQTVELQQRDLNECRAEITSLKMHIQGSRFIQESLASKADHPPTHSQDTCEGESKSLQIVTETSEQHGSWESVDNEGLSIKDKSIDIQASQKIDKVQDDEKDDLWDAPLSVLNDRNICKSEVLFEPNSESVLLGKFDNPVPQPISDKMGLDTIQILSDALPKVVPYVLINHREELIPLMICAIERHPDSRTRDSLTHTLFNLIKRPDGQQRQIIMDACIKLAKNVGEMRTETELLPQCWEQINHTHEERRLLVAKSCGELAEFVRPEIRDSLILSIIQQLMEDAVAVVREAAAHNLALLLPHFPDTDKYIKVEELMFQLVCDSSDLVVETALGELVPAVINWGNQLDHTLHALLSRAVYSAQHCPPLSVVEGSVESHLRVLGERERWNIDVLIRMLTQLLPLLHQKVVETCPYQIVSESNGLLLSASILETYSKGDMQWPFFTWLHTNCFLNLIQLACLLHQKEDRLRSRIAQFLWAVSERFGGHYLTDIMLPLFLVAIGDNSDLKLFPQSIQPEIKALRPKNTVAEKVSLMCILPLLLAGILGTPTMRGHLKEFLRKCLLRTTFRTDQLARYKVEMFNAVRFLSTFEEHHHTIFSILWEMVVHADTNIKIDSADLLKVIVPSIDVKAVSAHVLPALVTLGSDQSLHVKCASINAFGSVAQHFKNDTIVDKIHVQMDSFIEDGTHEAIVAVIRALAVAVPYTTVKLREYLLSKILQITSSPISANNVTLRCERANVVCEAIRALDATDISVTSVRDFLIPSIQNLLRDADSLDPAHKEALEIIMRERWGGSADPFSKVMGAAHINFPSSMTSFFGKGGMSMQKDGDRPLDHPNEDTRLRRIMQGGFTDMLKRQNQN